LRIDRFSVQLQLICKKMQRIHFHRLIYGSAQAFPNKQISATLACLNHRLFKNAVPPLLLIWPSLQDRGLQLAACPQ